MALLGLDCSQIAWEVWVSVSPCQDRATEGGGQEPPLCHLSGVSPLLEAGGHQPWLHSGPGMSVYSQLSLEQDCLSFTTQARALERCEKSTVISLAPSTRRDQVGAQGLSFLLIFKLIHDRERACAPNRVLTPWSIPSFSQLRSWVSVCPVHLGKSQDLNQELSQVASLCRALHFTTVPLSDPLFLSP